MTYQQLIEVCKAAEAGKKLQRGDSNQWINIDEDMTPKVICAWVHSGYELRVKPEPREWWFNTYKDGYAGRLWKTREAAEQSAEIGRVKLATIHVREVIE